MKCAIIDWNIPFHPSHSQIFSDVAKLYLNGKENFGIKQEEESIFKKEKEILTKESSKLSFVVSEMKANSSFVLSD